MKEYIDDEELTYCCEIHIDNELRKKFEKPTKKSLIQKIKSWFKKIFKKGER